ncbi:MAG: hypothetical protein KDC27_22205 [Acidobacteria bacterium]|nr:hypothetical protein [Acidobacteriota bacterium]
MLGSALRLALILSVATSAIGVVQAASLRAKRGAQAVQNERADDDNLSRMEDREMVERWVRLQLLERVPSKTSHYYLHAVHDENMYLRPWAKLFLERLSRQYHAKHRKPLRVTSLLRTASYQKRLSGRNGNAAAAEGPTRSAHLTGACLDISKNGMSTSERNWMRSVLSTLKSKGYLYAVEEFQQPVFHILIHRNYAGYVDQVLAKND